MGDSKVGLMAGTFAGLLIAAVASIVLIIATPPSSAATFTVNTTENTLQISGHIEPADELTFVQYISIYDFDRVLLGPSDGGNFWASMVIGRMVRFEKLITEIAGNCYSACSYIWLAGDQRLDNLKYEHMIHPPLDLFNADPDTGVPRPSPNSLILMSWYFGHLNMNPFAGVALSELSGDEGTLVSTQKWLNFLEGFE